MCIRDSSKTEMIAFSDSIIVPSMEAAMRQDTLWKDTVTIDTIKTCLLYTSLMYCKCMLSNEIVLYMFISFSMHV